MAFCSRRDNNACFCIYSGKCLRVEVSHLNLNLDSNNFHCSFLVALNIGREFVSAEYSSIKSLCLELIFGNSIAGFTCCSFFAKMELPHIRTASETDRPGAFLHKF